MALMVAYFLTFVIMLTFLDHSRLWYVGVFFINKLVLVMQKGLAMTLIFGQKNTKYIFSGFVEGANCVADYTTVYDKNMPKVDIHLRFCVAVIFLCNIGLYTMIFSILVIKTMEKKSHNSFNPPLKFGHRVCPGVY